MRKLFWTNMRTAVLRVLPLAERLQRGRALGESIQRGMADFPEQGERWREIVWSVTRGFYGAHARIAAMTLALPSGPLAAGEMTGNRMPDSR